MLWEKLVCLNFLVIPTLRTTFVRLISASFCIKQVGKDKLWCSSENTTQHGCPNSCSTLKGLITSVNTLSSFASAWVSSTLGSWGFVILANAHTMHRSSSSATPLTLVHSWPHRIDSNDPFACATSLHCQISPCLNSSWILERWRAK